MGGGGLDLVLKCVTNRPLVIALILTITCTRGMGTVGLTDQGGDHGNHTQYLRGSPVTSGLKYERHAAW